MSDLLPFLIAGLVAGSLYGLAAVGLVLTYRTSGIFNFAHGAVGAATAFAFYDLRQEAGLPWPLALALAAGVLAPLLGLVLSLVAGRLADASTSRRVVATVGALLAVQGLIQLRYGVVPITFTPFLPDGSIELGGTVVGADQLITIGIAASALLVLAWMFRSTRLGLEMRAVVDNPELLDLAGGTPQRVRATAWMLGSAFAGLTGILFAPTVGLDALLLTLLVIQAFGAAAFGRFNSFPLTFLGGLAIGGVQFLLRSPDVIDSVPLLDRLNGLDQSVSFVVLFAVLLLTKRGTFDEPHVTRVARPRRPLARQHQLVLVGVAAVAVWALPQVAPARAQVFIQAAVFVTIFASFHLLVEVAGQVSLCQVAFVAVGASSFCHFTTGAGLPWGIGVLLAALVAAPVGAIVAIPSMRLSGVFLALATLGFGVVIEQMAYNRPIMFGTLGQRSGARPDMAGLAGDAGYLYLCAGIAATAIALVVLVRRSRLGRLLNGLADAPVALATNGSSPIVTRVLVFCLASSMAALGGALSVGVVGSISSSGVSPSALVPVNSLLWLAALAFSGRSAVTSPVLAATALIVVPSYLTGPDLAQYVTIAFGLAALIVASVGEPLLRWIDDQRGAAAARVAHGPVGARNRRILEASGA